MTDRPERANEIDQAGDRTPASLPARYGRRALMLGAAATGAGVAASLVGGGLADAAPDGSAPVLLGKSNTTAGSTNVTSRSGTGLSGRAASKGQAGVSGFDSSKGPGAYGIFGHSVNGNGVLGISEHSSGIVGSGFTRGQSGVAGLDFCKTTGAHGLYGQSNVGFGVYGISFKGTGIVGQGSTSGQSGVAGIDVAPKGGTALFGQSHNGTAVFGTSDNGTALHAEGRVKFKNSGLVTVAGGSKTVKVKVPGMTTSSMVFATIQKPEAGVNVEGAQATAGSFTITLSKNATSALPIAWFVLD